MERIQIAPGVHLSCDPAEKFNRCRIAIHLRYPARRQSATDAAVLALVAACVYLSYRISVRILESKEF